MYIFGFSTNYIPLKTLLLPGCLCPKCGRNGSLEMTFLQQEQNGVVVHRLNKISGKLNCGSCGAVIPGKEWTSDIKIFFEREKQNLPVIKSLKISAYGKRLIGVAIGCFLLVGAIFAADKLGLLKENGKQPYQIESENNARYIAHPQVGDICKVVVMEEQDPDNAKYTLFEILGINEAEDQITVAVHKKNSADRTWNDLSEEQTDFNRNEPLTFSLKDYKFSSFTNDQNKQANIRINVLAVIRSKR